MAEQQEKNIYAFCNQKGGVGKTTTVINLGASLGKLGFKVLIVDADPQGNATSGFGVDKNAVEVNIYDNIMHAVPIEKTVIKRIFEYTDLIPANAHLAGAEIEMINLSEREYLLQKLLKPEKEKYDFIIIDCPPSLGLLTINALVAAERLVIPLQCEYYALEGLGQLINTYNLIHERLNKKIDLFGVVMTMADFRTNLTEQVINEVRSFFKEKVFNAVIPRSIKLSEAPGFGKPAVLYAPNSRGAFQYQLLTEEFLERLNIAYNYGEKREREDDKVPHQVLPEEVANNMEEKT